ncbi:FOG: RRM domain [Phaffia rhodozyma]|uniref:FOG: RRM domain n=1 Tax=Phaffia rhodozyma TaxID=264483 RepID=A0A0F7ST78_PHARH|nr:FOG: RRM domain [Phaffia rhodozyma]
MSTLLEESQPGKPPVTDNLESGTSTDGHHTPAVKLTQPSPSPSAPSEGACLPSDITPQQDEHEQKDKVERHKAEQATYQEQLFLQQKEQSHRLSIEPSSASPSPSLPTNTIASSTEVKDQLVSFPNGTSEGPPGSPYLPPHLRSEPAALSPTNSAFVPQDFRQFTPSASAVSYSGASGSAASSPSLTKEPSEKRTLWLGQLESWMDEAYLRSMGASLGWDVVSIKLIRQTSNQSGSTPTANNYCFLTFPTGQAASKILQSLTAVPPSSPILMPNSSRPFKANWAASSTTSSNPGAVNPAQATDLPLEKEFSIFVGDLAPEVSEADLVKLFLNPPVRSPATGGEPRKSFLSTRSAKIMLDPKNGGSRGYGFVRFAEEADQLRALADMQGVYCLSRPMRLSHATAKNRPGLALTSSNSQRGSSISDLSRGGTPVLPLSGHDQSTFAYQQQQQPQQPQFPSSDYPLPSPLSRPAESSEAEAGSPSDPPPPPPPQRRLSPSTIEYLTQLAAANGGTLPFGPGMTLPPFPQTSANSPSIVPSSTTLSAPVSVPAPAPASGSPMFTHPSVTQEYRAQPSDTILPVPVSNRSPPAAMPALSIGHSMEKLSPSTSARSQQPPQTAHTLSSSSTTSPSGIQGPASFPGTSSFSNSIHGTGNGQDYSPSQSLASEQSSGFEQNLIQFQQQQQQQQQQQDIGAVPVESTSTVFVGGLSSLISEETLKTFFVPFGEITYVKIPPGKGCGFVQFVRKADAERAIDRMQGFPIGGGRIRLSWGRSQYKATQGSGQLGMGGLGAFSGINGLTPAQAAQLSLALQGLGVGAGAGGGAANAALLRQLAAAGVGGNPGFNQRGANQNPLNGLGALGGLTGLGGGFGLNDPSAGLGGLNVGALAGLNPQVLQSLLALNGQLGNGLGNGLGGLAGLGALGGLGQGGQTMHNGGGLNPALLAQLGGLGGFNPINGHSSAGFNNSNLNAQYLQKLNGAGGDFGSYASSQSSGMADGRRQESFHSIDDRQREDDSSFGSFQQQQSVGGGRDPYSGSSHSPTGAGLGPSPTSGFRVPGSSISGPRGSIVGNGVDASPTSAFDPNYRPTIQSLADPANSAYFGTFTPPATAPGSTNNPDYLQQQQLSGQQQQIPPRTRAASASAHPRRGQHDLATEMENLKIRERQGSAQFVAPGSGRNLRYNSFAGGALRTSQLGHGSRFDDSRYDGGH